MAAPEMAFGSASGRASRPQMAEGENYEQREAIQSERIRR